MAKKKVYPDKFSYSIVQLCKNGVLQNGRTKTFACDEEQRRSCSEALLTTRRYIDGIFEGNFMLILINKNNHCKVDLFDDIIQNLIVACRLAGLSTPQTNIMLLIWGGVGEEKLAEKRNITEKQLNELLNNIYEVLKVNDFFQLNLLVQQMANVQVDSAAQAVIPQLMM